MISTREVREWYREAVSLSKTATPELKASLKTNDRVPAFIDTLASNLNKAIVSNAKKGIKHTRKTIQGAVYDLTEYFLYSLEQQAKQRTTSEIEKQRLKQEFDEKLNPEKYLTEMGVMTNDENKKENGKTNAV